MTTHASLDAGLSQNAKIWRVLATNRGAWVPMLALHEASGSMAVHSRIADLRKAGCVITQRNEQRGRMIASFYRLEAGDYDGGKAVATDLPEATATGGNETHTTHEQ